MQVVSIREMSPSIGKEEIMESRMRRASGVMSRYGAKSVSYRIAAGAGAGSYLHMNLYSTYAEAAGSFKAYTQDPEFTSLMRERALNPAGEIKGPHIFRTVYGAPTGKPSPVIANRIYSVPRGKQADMLALAPELEKLMKTVDVSVGAAVPIFADDHEMMGVVYRFSSMEHFGEALDKMTESTEFMDLVIKANEIGSLKMARMLSLM